MDAGRAHAFYDHQFYNGGMFTRRATIVLTAAVALLFGCAVHMVALDTVPAGMSNDEIGIGYDAFLISRSLHDQHGVFLPAVFRSSGDFKDPANIYVTALAFRIFPPTVFMLRFVSAMFFLLAAVMVSFLVWKSHARNSVMAFGILSFSVLPWFFVVFRLAWPASMFVAAQCVALLCVCFAFEGFSVRRHVFAGFAGVAAASSLFIYHSAKIAAPIFALTLVCLYWKQRKNIAVFLGAFILVLLPYAAVFFVHTDAATARFKQTTFLLDNSQSIAHKVTTFFSNYFAHLSPDFLLFSGDENLRHAAGFTGAAMFTVLALAIVGAYAAVRTFRASRFQALLLANALCAPLPAALTSDGIPHGTRTLLLGLYMVLLACGGFAFLLDAFRTPSVRAMIVCVAFFALSMESTVFLTRFFQEYPSSSARDFSLVGLAEAISVAVAKRPSRIFFSEEIDGRATTFLAEGYGASVGGAAQAGECVVRPKRDDDPPENVVGDFFVDCLE